MAILELPAQIEREDKVIIPGITIMPDMDAATKQGGAGIVLLAGEWGLTEDLKARFARPLAELGFWIVATDLVLGATAESAGDAKTRATGIDHENAIGDLQAAILRCKKVAAGKIGVMAFDLAARIAFEAATELPHIDSLVHASGPPPGDHARLARIRAFIQLHWSTKSAVLNQEDHDDLVKRIEPGRARLFGYKYDCNPDFYARPNGETEASNARIAWDRTRDFLFQTLT